MNRRITNKIRFFLDECLPKTIRNNKYFMCPFFYFWYKGKNIKTVMEFKSIAPKMTNEEYEKLYAELQCRGSDRKTEINSKCLKFIFEQLDPNSKSLLDVGCGKGYFLEKVHALEKYEIHGCDLFDKSPLKVGRYHRANIEKLPFSDKQFDIVTCFHTLEHTRNINAAMSELRRVAKKQLIICIPKQRYYYYTVDLHLHFFYEEADLVKLFGHNNFICKNLDGDWVCVEMISR